MAKTTKQPSYTSAVEQIGPAQAAKMLTKVHARQQGRHYKGTIDKYAREMAEGSWDINVPQSIALSTQGELMDGYHRLNAVVQSGVTLPFTVMRNVPAAAFSNIDAGRSRSLAFRCGLDIETAALASRLLALCFAGHPLRSTACTPSEMDVALDYIREDISLFNSKVSSTKRRTVTSAAVRLACILRMKAHPAFADEIAKQYRCLQQLELAEAHPVVVALYRRLASGEERDKDKVFALAWLAFDPDRRGNQKLQLTNLRSTQGQAQRLVLRPLMQLLEVKVVS